MQQFIGDATRVLVLGAGGSVLGYDTLPALVARNDPELTKYVVSSAQHGPVRSCLLI